MTQDTNFVAIAYPSLAIKVAYQVDMAICLFNQVRWGAQEVLNPLVVAGKMRGVDRRIAKRVGRVYEASLFNRLIRPVISLRVPHINKDIQIFPRHKLAEAKVIVQQAYTHHLGS